MTATTPSPTRTTVRKVAVPRTFDTWAWWLMRWSGLALLPLAWGHVLLQDVIVGVHRIDLNYAAWRWSFIGWQIYDIALLGFAFAHGMNGATLSASPMFSNKPSSVIGTFAAEFSTRTLVLGNPQ